MAHKQLADVQPRHWPLMNLTSNEVVEPWMYFQLKWLINMGLLTASVFLSHEVGQMDVSLNNGFLINVFQPAAALVSASDGTWLAYSISELQCQINNMFYWLLNNMSLFILGQFIGFYTGPGPAFELISLCSFTPSLGCWPPLCPVALPLPQWWLLSPEVNVNMLQCYLNTCCQESALCWGVCW